MVIENEKNTITIEEADKKKEAYNRYWNDENYKFEILGQSFNLKEYFNYVIKKEKEYFKEMAEFNKEQIPNGKFILFINVAEGGVIDNPELNYVNKEKVQKMIEAETGYKDTENKDFQEQNMRRRLGFEKDDNRFKVWNAFYETAPLDLENCVGIVISGSKINLHDEKDRRNFETAEKIEAFLKDKNITKLPQFGICFGAQMLAKINGAEIQYVLDEDGKNKRITGLKRVFIKEESKVFPELQKGQSFKIATNHEQMINPKNLPKGSEIIGDNYTCPEIITILKENGAVSILVQSHIEVGETRLMTGIDMTLEPEPPENLLKEFSPELIPIIFKNFIRIVGERAKKN